MNIVLLSFGRGGGHLSRALAVYEGLRRHLYSPFSLTVLTDCIIDVGSGYEDIEFCQILVEPEKQFLDHRSTALYNILKHLDPDLILSDLSWLIIRPVLHEFKCRKVIFFRYLHYDYFHVPSVDGLVHSFDPAEYDLSFTIDPNFRIEGCDSLSPLINIHERTNKKSQIIRDVLEVPRGKKLALLAHNGLEGELEQILSEVDVNPDEYCIRTISSFDHDISMKVFPLAHYMSGVDLAIGGCGYNFFYETKALGIQSLYFPQPRKGNEQHWRLEHCLNYNGPYDGADQMVKRILELF